MRTSRATGGTTRCPSLLCRRIPGIPAGTNDMSVVGEASGRIIDTDARYPLISQGFFGHRRRRPRPMTKYVYFFGGGHAEGSSLMRNLLGGKGCELAEMTNLGIPVPPGLTITKQAWAAYNRTGRQFPEGLWDQVIEALTKLEGDSGLTFGDPQRPLLVSVRSGARVSM